MILPSSSSSLPLPPSLVSLSLIQDEPLSFYLLRPAAFPMRRLSADGFFAPAEPDGEGAVRQRPRVPRGAGLPEGRHPDGDRAEHGRLGGLVALLPARAPGHRPRQPPQAAHRSHVREPDAAVSGSEPCGCRRVRAEASCATGAIPGARCPPGCPPAGHLSGAARPGRVPGPPKECLGCGWYAN